MQAGEHHQAHRARLGWSEKIAPVGGEALKDERLHRMVMRQRRNRLMVARQTAWGIELVEQGIEQLLFDTDSRLHLRPHVG